MPTWWRTISLRYFRIAFVVICACICICPVYVCAQTTIFSANFENAIGDNLWTFNGGASDGNWLRGIPNPYNTGSVTMEIALFEGIQDLLPGNQFIQDVDAEVKSQISYDYAEAADLGIPSKVEAAVDLISATDNSQLIQAIDCIPLISDDFETGLGNWDDPGSDVARINNSEQASNGSYSLRIRDNTSTSVTTSTMLDLSMADTALVNFSFITRSMEADEDFWLQMSTDGGLTYTTVRTWVSRTDFVNNTRYFENVRIPGPFTANTRFRFVCNASNNGDQVYLDEIVISSCVAETVVCPTLALADTVVCRPEMVLIDGDPQGDSIVVTGHQWTDLGTGTATGYTLINDTSQVLTVDAMGTTPGTVFLEYEVSTANCTVTDTLILQILSDPICEIITETDTICNGTSLTIEAFQEYLVSPDTGFVVPAGSGSGFTEIHEIIGVQDPASTKVIITLPTWDDHFDSILLNGQMIIPQVFQPQSYNATGMNCVTPWFPNENGLPRSIIEITSTSVRYFSSVTTTSTTMTEVFPTNWVTTPQPFVVGTNYLQFGIDNTAGPVSGSWFVEAIGTVGYTYAWSTGDTSTQITVNPTTTTTYSLTVTSPTGCSSTCEKTITVADPITENVTYNGCSGDGYGIVVNGTMYDETNPTDTIVLTTSSGCDSTIYVNLNYAMPSVVEAGASPFPICSNMPVILADLNPSITGGISTGMWTSSGGGTFDNGGIFGGSNPATIYTPSMAEIDLGKVILTLTSDDPPSSCEPEADAVMILINDIRCSNFPWTGTN